MSAQWLNSIKVALIEEEHKMLSSLCEELPHFEDIKEMQEANDLLQEAITFLKDEQNKTQETMAKIKKNSAFLSQEKKKPRLSTLS